MNMVERRKAIKDRVILAAIYEPEDAVSVFEKPWFPTRWLLKLESIVFKVFRKK